MANCKNLLIYLKLFPPLAELERCVELGFIIYGKIDLIVSFNSEIILKFYVINLVVVFLKVLRYLFVVNMLYVECYWYIIGER